MGEFQRLLLCFLLFVLVQTQLAATGEHGREEALKFSSEFPLSLDFSNSTGGKLHCKAHGLPHPSITWLLVDGSPVTPVPRLRQPMPDGSLVFPPFAAEDYRQDVHGVSYKCSATNSLGTIVSNEIKVRGVVYQAFDVHVYDVYAIRGNTAVIRCHIPKFLSRYVNVTSWIKDSVIAIVPSQLDTTSKYLVLPSGELIIKDVDDSDGHTSYHCQVTHRLTKETKRSLNPGRLIVTDSQGKVPPKMVHSQTDVSAKKGEIIYLPCVANGNPAPRYTWTKQTTTGLSEKIILNQRVKMMPGSLVIENSRGSDSGTYICIADNEMNSDKITVQVTVFEPLKVTTNPTASVVDANQAITISCKVIGSPVRTINWFKDGMGLSNNIRKENNDTLVIPNMDVQSAGLYQCTAENDFFTTSATTVLKLGDTMPVITEGFEEQTLAPGSELKMQCKAKGNPTPQIQWTLDTFDVPFNDRGKIHMKSSGINEVTSIFTISSVKVEDGGAYFCFAKTKKGQVYHAARINVNGKLGSRTDVNYQVNEGETKQLECPVYGSPILNIVWKKGNRILPLNVRQAVHRNGSLLIRNVQSQNDNGKYTCIATGMEDDFIKAEMKLTVMVPPKVTPFSFQDELIREGARARIQCVIREGQSPIKIIWLKDGHIIEQDQGIVIHDIDEFSSILMISSISPRHNGNYTCKATNPAGTAQHTAPLFVNVPPKWTFEQEHITASAGQYVLLNCQAEGFPVPVITWEKATNSDNLAAGRRKQIFNTENVELHSNGSLSIENIQRSDEGFYICVADNDIQEPLSHIVLVKVQAAPEFNETKRNIEVIKGEGIDIFCDASGNWPISYAWSVGGQKISGENTRYKIHDLQDKVLMKSVSKLHISWADRKDSTIFYCKASNDIGEKTLEINLMVQENPDAPEIEESPKVLNQTVELSWTLKFDGNSEIIKYHIHYKKEVDRWDDKLKSLTVSGKTNTVKIGNLKPATTYTFRVIAENKIGNGSFSKIVKARTDENAPEGPPENVDVESTDANTLRVTWKPPKKQSWNGAIRGYNVGYKVHGTTNPFTFTALEVPEDYTEELIYQLTDLNMYTQYDIIVQAYNSKGTGPNSEVILAMTSEDVPSSPPQDVRCSSLSSKSIYVLWDAPPSETVNGILRGYKILFKPVQEWYDAMTQSKILETPKVTISDLDVNTNYSIQVLAFTKMGDGVKSSPIYCRTHEDVPEPPESIKVLPSSSDSVLVSWKAPQKSNGALVKYSIYYKPIEHGDQSNIDTQRTEELQKDASIHQSSAGSQSVELKGLKKNKKYAFWVTATSAIGESDGSAVVAQTVAESIVAAKTGSFDSIIKTPWQEDIVLPCLAVGVPSPNRKWSIGDYPLQESNRVKIKSDGSVVINKASSEDSGNYTCAVYNEHGRDHVSYLVAVQVPPSAPIVDIISKSRTSIKLQWKPGVTGGESIRGYLLHFKEENGVWNSVEIRPDQALYILENLVCGAAYQLYMEAFNNIGTGLPSEVIKFTTDGADVAPPAKDQVIREGSTFVTVHLEAWPAIGCPIKSFTAEYRPIRGQDWTIASSKIRPSQKKLVISGLNSATWYMLRLTVESSNKPTVAEYRFATHTPNGGTIAPETFDESLAPVYIFYLDPLIFIPAVALLIVVIITSVVLCFYFKRRNGSIGTPEPSESGMHLNTWINSQMHTIPRSHFGHGNRHSTTLPRRGADPSPYATSHLTDWNHPEHGKSRPGSASAFFHGNQEVFQPQPMFVPSGATNETKFLFAAPPSHTSGTVQQSDDGYDPPPLTHMVRN